MRVLLIVLMALALVGCKEGGAITCLTLKGYSPAFMAAAADEIERLDKTAPHIVQLLNDCGVERDAIRECLRRQKAAPFWRGPLSKG